MRRGNFERNDSGLSGERLGLVHRYMIEAPPEPPRRVPRWTPTRRRSAGQATVAPTVEAAVELPRVAHQSGPAPAAAQAAPLSTPPQEEAPPTEVGALQPASAADAEPAVSQEPVAAPAAFEEAEAEPSGLEDVETVPTAFQEAETESTALGEAEAEPTGLGEAETVPIAFEEAEAEPSGLEEAETVPTAFQEAETVEVLPVEALAPEHDAGMEEDSAAADLPIHLWVQAPGANGTEADPAWPQELVRVELERSLRARDRDRPRDD